MPTARSKNVVPLPVNVLYHANLRAKVLEEVNDSPKARVHRVEWSKIMDGQPVEINPSVGSGYKVMTVGKVDQLYNSQEILHGLQSTCEMLHRV